MKIRNFLNVPMVQENIHDGIGLCDHCALWEVDDFDAPIRFLNYTIIPAGCSFGQHQHGDDNEIYIVLEGEGDYTENGETVHVVPGDVMMNARFASHGIVNTTDVPLRLLVIEGYNR